MTDPRDLIKRLAEELNDLHCHYNVPNQSALIAEAHAYLAQPEPVPVSADAAFAIGQTGGPPSEVERLAFEAWMRGHSWLVSGKWNGTTYVDPQERHSSIDLPAMQTRMLWAAWRDRAALTQPEPEGPTDEEIERFADKAGFVEGHAYDECGFRIHDEVGFARALLARWGRAYVPPELIRALELAEAALADIGDAEREPGDDLAWAEARAAQDLPRIRAVLARWGKQ